MGYLYNEVIECKNKKLLKLAFAGLIFLLLLDIFTTMVLAIRGYAAEVLLICLPVFILSIVPAYLIWAKTRCRYKYSIIDNELIIERLSGSKRFVLLNINLKAIERLERIDGKHYKSAQWRRFSFMGEKSSGCLCLYKLNGNISGFYFQPSQKLLEKIYNSIGEKVVA